MKRAFAIGISALAMNVVACSTDALAPSGSGPHAVPFILQGGSGSMWATFNSIGAYIIEGPDKRLWGSSLDGAVAFNVATGVAQEYPASGFVGPMAVGSDGNIWFCGNGSVGKFTTAGVFTFYSVPNATCRDVTEGPDGAMWFADYGNNAIGRVSTDGTVTEYPTPAGESPQWGITSGLDGGIWWTETCGCRPGQYLAIARIDPETHAITEFKPSRTNKNTQMLMIVAGKNGDLYAGTFINKIMQLNPRTGRFNSFPVNGPMMKTADQRNLFTSPPTGTGAWRWNISTRTENSLGFPPGDSNFYALFAAIGPDGNDYFYSANQLAVYINKILTVSPLSATLGIGGTQTFDVAENGNPNIKFVATSSDPNIVSVSSVVSGVFTATGVTSGSAIITVRDSKQNDVLVSVTVQQ